ncbi:multidrug effflux MFS transporter [Novosphingobium sp.]|uniref:multidrug effflux MFS transporter n=1 Tax=Novosphingobium sp. TaxID=1874826 RepID=UPI002613CB88|nr:multidrug effflux MFS transporter [Novosphingobium sp.]
MHGSASSPADQHPTRPAFAIGERELIVMVALIMSLQALAIDAMLPGLPQIAGELGVTSPNHRQLIVGLFMGGVAFGSLIPGPLADRYGRRRVLLAGLVCYVLVSVACALVTEFNTMLAFRTIGGFACASMSVVPSAVIRDRFDGDRMARLQSLIAVIFLIVPMIAPTIGQGILVLAGWRWIFGMMAVMGVLGYAWVALRLPESLDPEHRQPIRTTVIARNMAETFTNRTSLGYILASACPLGLIWGWVQCCEQLLGEHFGAGEQFPYYFGGMALFMACGNFANSRIVERFGARRVAHTALLVYILVAALQVYLAHLPHQSLWQFVPVMALSMMLSGFMSANFSSIALQPFARTAGSASSVQSFVRLVIGTVIGLTVGQAYDQSARPLAHGLLAAGLTSLALILWSERGKLFRRVIPPGMPRPA